jgi:hypothetical protein
VKGECLNRIVPVGEWHLRRTLQEFATHYHRERNHQGLAERGAGRTRMSVRQITFARTAVIVKRPGGLRNATTLVWSTITSALPLCAAEQAFSLRDFMHGNIVKPHCARPF